MTSNHRQDRPLSKPKGVGKVYVALKRIYVTSSPIRIFNELDILNMLRYVCFSDADELFSCVCLILICACCSSSSQRSVECCLSHLCNSLRRSGHRRDAFQSPSRLQGALLHVGVVSCRKLLMSSSAAARIGLLSICDSTSPTLLLLRSLRSTQGDSQLVDHPS